MYLKFVTSSTRQGVAWAAALALVTLFAVCAWMAPAQAKKKTWKPSSTKIVIGQSIGGVKIGATSKDAAKAWGGVRKGSKGWVKTKIQKATLPAYRTFYLLPNLTRGFGQDARFNLSNKSQNPGKWKNSRVYSIQLVAPKALPGGPISKFRTSKGIGIGSTIDELKRAYPQIITDDGAGATWDAAHPECTGMATCPGVSDARPNPTYYFLNHADKTWRITAFKSLDTGNTIEQIYMAVTGPTGG